MKQAQPNQTNTRADVPQNQFFRRCAAPLAAVALSCLASPTLAQISYNIADASTSLTLSGTALGGTYGGQGGNPLTLVDHWSGNIWLTETTPGNYTFSGSITADLNPLTPFLPAGGGTPPVLGGTDNYGAYTLALGFYPLYTAYRDMTVSITGGNAVQGGSAPVTGMNLGLTAGHLDFDAPSITGYRGTVGLSSWVSPSGANTSSGSVLLSADGSTLTVPVTFATESYNAGIYGGVFETWTGTLVAVIPEPSSVALVGLGLAALAARNARRGKRSL
jgi:hypothetical protein